jgi:TetR/AcrR family transcriptional repressor of mexJK operon
MEAATTLFLRQGYAGTTMEEIAVLAGITKRTVYNNYSDKAVLFTQIVMDMIAIAEEFARSLRTEFDTAMSAAEVRTALHDLARRMALAIVRPEVIALRRLLIGEAREFPTLGGEYFDRAPRLVLDALAAGFEELTRAKLLRAHTAHGAAEQFAYLAVGAPLDQAILVGRAPTKPRLISCAREGVETFLARYAPLTSRRRAARYARQDSDR